MRKIKQILCLLLMGTAVMADTPPPGAVKIKGGTDGTLIGNVADSQKVNVTNAVTATVSSSLGSPLYTQLVVSGAVIDPRVIRALSSGTDSVNVGNFPSTFGVTQSTSPWVISGTVTSNIGTTNGLALDSSVLSLSAKFGSLGQKLMSGSAPVVIASDQSAIPVTGTFFQAVQPVSQSGIWTTGRTWSLLNTTDSVNVGNFPATQAVTQSTSPWVMSGTVTSNIGTTNGLALDSTLSALSAKFGSLGQKTMVGSAPVVIASDQSAIPVTGTFFQAVQPVSQSGTWTTGRTWSLLNTTDSVNVGNFPATFGVTQSTSPWVISGTVTANAGTNLNTSALALDATLTGGTQKTQINNGANTAAVKAASTAAVATDPALVVAVSPNNSVSVTQATAANLNATVVGSGNFTVVQPTGSNLHAQLDSGSTTAVTQATAANLNATVVQSSGANLHVNIDSAPTTTVTGTVTANQGTSPWVSNISQFGGSNVVTGTGASGVGIPRVTVSNDSNVLATQSGTWNINNISGTVSLPTGAATASNQTTLGSQTTKVNDGTNTMAVKAASTAPAATDPAAVVTLSPNGNQAKDTSVTGLQVTQGSTTSGQSGTLIQGAVTTNSPSYTTAQTSPLSLNLRGGLRSNIVGGDTAQIIRNDYSSTNVTTAAYVQLVASTTANINRLWIFDSSGQDFVLATGAAASEVDQIQIPPGGWDAPVDIFIASGTRLSIKSKSATASSGILLITGIK